MASANCGLRCCHWHAALGNSETAMVGCGFDECPHYATADKKRRRSDCVPKPVSARSASLRVAFFKQECIGPIFEAVKPNRVSVAFARLCRRQRVLDFRFHDLRHTAASWLRMQGADIHTVALLLGHKDLRMAARYQHLSPAYLADAVKRLDDLFPNLPPFPLRTGGDCASRNRETGQSSCSIVPTASPEYFVGIMK